VPTLVLRTGMPSLWWGRDKGERMLRRFVVGSILTGSLALVMIASASSADSAPSGQRMFGNTSFDSGSGHFTGGGGTIEPAFNDSTGKLVYLRTPNNAQPAKNLPQKMVPFGDLGFSMPVNVAPIFLPVYPKGSNIEPGSLNCAHVDNSGIADNCIDHGPAVAGAVVCIDPAVYAQGGTPDPGCATGSPNTSNVLGHDHLVGVAQTGGDFNVLWEPVLVLFTSVNPQQARITTLAQIEDAVNVQHTAFLVPLPPLIFPCSVEGAAAYDNATPAPTWPPLG
jgi:hypothetical protein